MGYEEVHDYMIATMFESYINIAWLFTGQREFIFFDPWKYDQYLSPGAEAGGYFGKNYLGEQAKEEEETVTDPEANNETTDNTNNQA